MKRQFGLDVLKEYCDILNVNHSKALSIYNDEEREFFKQLTDEWYKRIKADSSENSSAFNLYGDQFYFTDLIKCYGDWSERSIKSLKNKNFFNDFKFDVVVDVGCGLGLSTNLLREMCPNAKVFGTNLPNTDQYTFCKTQAKKNGWILVPNSSHVSHLEQGKSVFVFASEYFEHFRNPISELDGILEELKPTAIAAANAFKVRALGHFNDNYITSDGEQIKSRTMAIKFNQCLKDAGFERLNKYKCYNAKPELWTKITQTPS